MVVPPVTCRRAVHFQIRFVHDEQTDLVAKLIKFGHIWIVRRTHRIHVQLFHQTQILHDIRKADRRARIGVEIMTVYPFQFDMLAVDLEYLAVDTHFTETDLFHDLFPLGKQSKGVQIRVFCRPFFRVFHRKLDTSPRFYKRRIP